MKFHIERDGFWIVSEDVADDLFLEGLAGRSAQVKVVPGKPATLSPEGYYTFSRDGRVEVVFEAK